MNPAELVNVVGRAVFEFKVEGQSQVLHWNDPTLAALGGLMAAMPFTEPMQIGFVRGGGQGSSRGGIPALVRILRESSCPLMLHSAVKLITGLMGFKDPDGHLTGREDVADTWLAYGGLPFLAIID